MCGEAGSTETRCTKTLKKVRLSVVFFTVVAEAVSLHVAVIITALIPHQDKKERYILASKQVGEGVQSIFKTCLLLC